MEKNQAASARLSLCLCVGELDKKRPAGIARINRRADLACAAQTVCVDPQAIERV
jgi:hypothetical protein